MSESFVDHDRRFAPVAIPGTAALELAHHGFDFTQPDTRTMASDDPDIIGTAVLRQCRFMMNDGLNGAAVEIAIEANLQAVFIFLDAVHDFPYLSFLELECLTAEQPLSPDDYAVFPQRTCTVEALSALPSNELKSFSAFWKHIQVIV